MGKDISKSSSSSKKVVNKPIPAKTISGRESKLIKLAVDLAEQQLMDGTATSQVICHFLKLGTTNAELEKEKLKSDVELLKIKAKSIEQQDNNNELYNAAINAMKEYSGESNEDL